MPQNPVIVNLSAARTAVAQETFDDVVVFGAGGGTAPPQGYNIPRTYRNATDVATDAGDGSDVHVASQMLDGHGVEEWDVVVLDTTTTSETLSGSDTSAVNAGTVTNTPMAGNSTPTITIDGAAVGTVEATTESPPGADTAPASGEALYNPDTGEIRTGDSSSGTGAGIVVTYDHHSWTTALGNVDGSSMDLALIADVRATPANVGDLDTLIQWSSGNYTFVPVGGPNGAAYDTEADALAETQDVAAYLSSGYSAMWAHKSSSDVGADLAGMHATRRPWYDVTNKTGLRGNYSQFYSETLIGAPEDAGTFEGGMDAASGAEGAGPVNVIRQYAGSTVSSNDLTTAGASSMYQRIRAARIEGFTITKAREALTSLSIDNDVVFDHGGRLEIEDALVSNFQPFDYSAGPYADISIYVPMPEDISESNRQNRIWGPITIEYTPNTLAHRYELNINATVRA